MPNVNTVCGDWYLIIASFMGPNSFTLIILAEAGQQLKEIRFISLLNSCTVSEMVRQLINLIGIYS